MDWLFSETILKEFDDDKMQLSPEMILMFTFPLCCMEMAWKVKTQIWNDKHMLMWQSYRNERNRPCKGLGKYIYQSLVCSFLYNYMLVPFFFPKLNQKKCISSFLYVKMKVRHIHDMRLFHWWISSTKESVFGLCWLHVNK